MVNLFLSLLIPILVGFFLFSIIENRLSFFLKILFSIPLGFGLTSILYILWLFSGLNFVFYEIVELIILFSTGFIYFKSEKPVCEKKHFEINKKYLYLFILMNLLAVCLFVYYYINNPLGSWDGWRIWNMKAEFLFKGGEYWKNIFLQPSPLVHVDYPLFLPAIVARIWKYLHVDITYIPAFIAFLFTFLIPVLIFGFFRHFNFSNKGLLCASSLLGIQMFILSASGQMADVPLSFFILSGICLIFLAHDLKSDRLLLISGLICGMSAWVKNEGFLFIFAISIALLAVLLKSREISKIKYFFVGLIPILFLILIFKLNIPVQNDLIEGIAYCDMPSKIFDFSRYLKVFEHFIKFLFENVSFYILILIFAFTGLKIPDGKKDPVIISTIFLSIMILGYFFIYVLTPNNIDWQLGASFNRVILQIWPSVLLTAFVVVCYPVGENQ